MWFSVQCNQTGVHLVLQAVVCKGQAGAMLKGCRRQTRAAVAAWSTLACQHPAANVHLEPHLPMLAQHTCQKTGAKMYLFCLFHCRCNARLLDNGMVAAIRRLQKMKSNLILDTALHFASAIDTTHLLHQHSCIARKHFAASHG